MIGFVVGFCWAWGNEIINDYRKQKKNELDNSFFCVPEKLRITEANKKN